MCTCIGETTRIWKDPLIKQNCNRKWCKPTDWGKEFRHPGWLLYCARGKSVVSATQFYPLRLERHNYNRQNQLCLQDNSLVCNDKFCNTVVKSTIWFARIPFLNEWVVNLIAKPNDIITSSFCYVMVSTTTISLLVELVLSKRSLYCFENRAWPLGVYLETRSQSSESTMPMAIL